MAVLLVAGTTVAGVAFMAIFFAALCKEGSRMKICAVMKVDTESMVAAEDSRLCLENLTPLDAHRAGTILPITAKTNRIGESKDARYRRPA